jgi:hypothetical protein
MPMPEFMGLLRDIDAFYTLGVLTTQPGYESMPLEPVLAEPRSSFLAEPDVLLVDTVNYGSPWEVILTGLSATAPVGVLALLVARAEHVAEAISRLFRIRSEIRRTDAQTRRDDAVTSILENLSDRVERTGVGGVDPVLVEFVRQSVLGDLPYERAQVSESLAQAKSQMTHAGNDRIAAELLTEKATVVGDQAEAPEPLQRAALQVLESLVRRLEMNGGLELVDEDRGQRLI